MVFFWRGVLPFKLKGRVVFVCRHKGATTKKIKRRGRQSSDEGFEGDGRAKLSSSLDYKKVRGKTRSVI